MTSKKYTGESSDSAVLDVAVGDYRLAEDDYSLSTENIFTCVAVGIYDEEEDLRGLMHANTPGKDSGGVLELLNSLADKFPESSDPENWNTYIVGGSFDPDVPDLGMENATSARSWLEDYGVSDIELYTGGEFLRDAKLSPEGKINVEKEDRSDFNSRPRPGFGRNF